jgi:hypothetical protein
MRAGMALEDDEIERGAILICQSVASQPNIALIFSWMCHFQTA